jgi:hypothetical protein
MTMGERYILDGQTPVPCEDLFTWGEWFENDAHRRVGLTITANGSRVSTVFLGLDHAFGSGPPVLFETMIFGGPHDGYQARYTTWDEAEAGHARAVTLAETEDAHGHATGSL